MCSPTRASIVTGRTPTRDCVDKAQGCMDQSDCSMRFPLPLNSYTIADLAHAYRHKHRGGAGAGDISKQRQQRQPDDEDEDEDEGAGDKYATAIWGKWHLGNLHPKPRRTVAGSKQTSRLPQYVAHPGMFGFDEFNVAEDQVRCIIFEAPYSAPSKTANDEILGTWVPGPKTKISSFAVLEGAE